jgi:diguanylate cyclase (GGDEF)-like protein
VSIVPTNKSAISELAERLRWVIGIRWTVVIALLLVGVLGSVVRGDSAQAGLVHLGLACLVAAYNVFYLVITRQPGFGATRASRSISLAQIPLDLFVFTAIVHFSGGVTGPVFVLYFLYIFVGLAILPPAGAYVVALLAAFFYGTLALSEATWLPTAGQQSAITNPLVTYMGYFLTVSAMLMIIAYIANYFAGLLTRGERTIRSQLEDINVLYGFTRAASSTMSSEEILNSLATAAQELDGADACSVLLLNDRGEGVLAAGKGFTQEDLDLYSRQPIPIDSSAVRKLVTQGEGLYAPDVEKVPGLRQLLFRPKTRSFYGIPLMNDKRLIGSLNLSFDRSYEMPMEHWNLLIAMAQQAALAIERTRLFGDTQRSAQEMTSLYHIGLTTTSSLQIDEVLRLIYQQVDRVLHPDTFYIALFEEERHEFRYELFIENGVTLPPFRARSDSIGITNWVVRNNRPLFVRHWNAEKEQLPFEGSMVGNLTQSIMSVPLVAKNKIVGVMSVQALEPYAFDQTQLRLVTAIASQAALALENAQLHATVNEQAQRDPLTGAYNHGTLIFHLQAAIERAQAAKETVAFIMLDIDRFKQYNDTYGHLIGDDVLRATVEAILSHLKSTDVVGRWGGEEFCVVLPGVTREQARAVAERIKNTVASNVMRDMHNRPIPSATVSQGMAVYSEDAITLEELIHKADTALYAAKARGRNRICDWRETLGNDEPVPLRAAMR